MNKLQYSIELEHCHTILQKLFQKTILKLITLNYHISDRVIRFDE